MAPDETIAPGWLRVDEFSDVASSLDALAVALTRAADGKHGAWKWALLAAHSAWAGAAVVAVSREGRHNAFKDRQRREWLEWAYKAPDVRGDPPDWKYHLAGPRELIDRIQDPSFLRYDGGEPLSLSADEAAAIGFLNNRRDELIHFEPSGRSICLASCTAACRVAVDLAARLMLGHPGVARRLDEGQRAVFRKRVGEVNGALALWGVQPIAIPG